MVTDVIADGMRVVRVDMLSGEVLIGVDVDMLSGFDTLSEMEIIAMATLAITLEFVVEIACTGDALTDVSAAPITDIVPGTDVDILNDENINGLAAVMTRVGLTLSSSWKDAMPFC